MWVRYRAGFCTGSADILSALGVAPQQERAPCLRGALCKGGVAGTLAGADRMSALPVMRCANKTDAGQSEYGICVASKASACC